MDLLLERVNEITKQADQRNKENIQAQSYKVTEEWATLVSDLENRRDTLTGLAQVRNVKFDKYNSSLVQLCRRHCSLFHWYDYTVENFTTEVESYKAIKFLDLTVTRINK